MLLVFRGKGADVNEPWKIKRTAQCAKCPWRVETNPRDIPRGYSEEKHKGLVRTIAGEDSFMKLYEPLYIMACHEDHESHCIGWLHNQLGAGNNIPLRIAMRSCTNADKIRLRGKQHERFEDTLPKEAKP